MHRCQDGMRKGVRGERNQDQGLRCRFGRIGRIGRINDHYAYARAILGGLGEQGASCGGRKHPPYPPNTPKNRVKLLIALPFILSIYPYFILSIQILSSLSSQKKERENKMLINFGGV